MNRIARLPRAVRKNLDDIADWAGRNKLSFNEVIVELARQGLDATEQDLAWLERVYHEARWPKTRAAANQTVDRATRQQAIQIAHEIKRALESNPKLLHQHVSGAPFYSLQSHEVNPAWPVFTLSIWPATQNRIPGTYDPEKHEIGVNVLPRSAFEGESTAQEFLRALGDPPIENLLVHELIHHLDHSRAPTLRHRKQKYDHNAPNTNYYNDAAEFNAHYQAGAAQADTKLEHLLQSMLPGSGAMKRNMGAAFGSTPEEFLHKYVWYYWSNLMLNSLSPKMQRHFQKRVVAWWKNAWAQAMPQHTAATTDEGGHSLFVFDFDGTLFRSPDNPKFPGYWWNQIQGLEPPCVPTEPNETWWITDTLEAAREAQEDHNIVTLLLTGRKDETFHDRVFDLLEQQDLVFDRIELRPGDAKSAPWKLDQILDELQDHASIHVVDIWDDREEHLDEIVPALEEAGFEVHPHLVVESVPVCNPFKHHAPEEPQYDGQDRTGCAGRAPNTRQSGRSNYGRRAPASTAARETRGAGRLRRSQLATDPSAAHQYRDPARRNAKRIYLAQEPDQPTETKMVQQLENDPGAKWRELYLQPIIRAIRNQLDLRQGQVVLLGPRKEVPFESDSLGFTITGHVKFTDFVPPDDPYGTAPYTFTATILPDGKMQQPIQIQGAEP